MTKCLKFLACIWRLTEFLHIFIVSMTSLGRQGKGNVNFKLAAHKKWIKIKLQTGTLQWYGSLDEHQTGYLNRIKKIIVVVCLVLGWPMMESRLDTSYTCHSHSCHAAPIVINIVTLAICSDHSPTINIYNKLLWLVWSKCVVIAGLFNKVKLFLQSQYCHVNICLDKAVPSLSLNKLKLNSILNDISWSCFTKGKWIINRLIKLNQIISYFHCGYS